jgi:hypothetical protein
MQGQGQRLTGRLGQSVSNLLSVAYGNYGSRLLDSPTLPSAGGFEAEVVVFNHHRGLLPKPPMLAFCLLGFGLGVRDSHFGEAIAEGIARQAQRARGLAFVAVGLAQRFADCFLFPLIERHSWRKYGG